MLMTAWCCGLILTLWTITESYSRRASVTDFTSNRPYLSGTTTRPTKVLGRRITRRIRSGVEIPKNDTTHVEVSLNDTSGVGASLNDTSELDAENEFESHRGSDSKIVGGREARTGEFPWIVSLSWMGGMHFCGGSLLTLKHVLTACHCTCRYKDDVDEDVIDAGDFTINGGSLYTHQAFGGGSTVQERLPKTVKIHPSCRSRIKGGYLFDYSIVQPEMPFVASPTLQVIKLISLDQGATWKYLTNLVKNKRWCKAVGWGTTGVSTTGYVNISDTLKVVGVQLISFSQCHELLSNFSKSYQTIDVQSRYQVCAKNDEKSDACRGDSGGGFVCGTYVFGLLSWGPTCGEKNTPSMYASIDGGWDFIVKSIISLTSRIFPAQRLLAAEFTFFILNNIRNI